MKGTIVMEFNSPKTTIDVNVEDMDMLDKCVAVNGLLNALNTTVVEKFAILTLVIEVMLNRKEEGKNESGCI